MPAWVRSLLEEAMARAQRRGGTLDLKALAQQVKLPLSLLRLWASQVSAANTPRAVTEPGRVSSVVDVLRTAVNEAIWAGANAVRRKGLKLRADFETIIKPNLETVVIHAAAITVDFKSGNLTQDRLRGSRRQTQDHQ